MGDEVFQHLIDEQVNEYMKKFTVQGMSEEDSFTETLSIDCNMDEEDDDKEYVENSGCDSRLWKGDLIW